MQVRSATPSHAARVRHGRAWRVRGGERCLPSPHAARCVGSPRCRLDARAKGHQMQASSPQHPSEHASRVALAAGETLISNAQSANQMETEMRPRPRVCVSRRMRPGRSAVQGTCGPQPPARATLEPSLNMPCYVLCECAHTPPPLVRTPFGQRTSVGRPPLPCRSIPGWFGSYSFGGKL